MNGLNVNIFIEIFYFNRRRWDENTFFVRFLTVCFFSRSGGLWITSKDCLEYLLARRLLTSQSILQSNQYDKKTTAELEIERPHCCSWSFWWSSSGWEDASRGSNHRAIDLSVATFCALYTMNEQIEVEGVVNIYELAKLYHIKRSGIWRHNVSSDWTKKWRRSFV